MRLKLVPKTGFDFWLTEYPQCSAIFTAFMLDCERFMICEGVRWSDQKRVESSSAIRPHFLSGSGPLGKRLVLDRFFRSEDID